jgi:hypothetical protein
MFFPGALLLLFAYVVHTVLYTQILKPAEKKAKYPYGAMNAGRPVTPPRKQKKKDGKMG